MVDPLKAPAGCDAVNEHVSKPIPAILWHYTSFTGLLGIVTSRKIWATEYRFLNDREEFLHAKKLALEVVEEEPESTNELFSARDIVRKGVNGAFNTGFLHEDRLRVMVASFSASGDQLSQWRGYAGDSTGVSIGLDLGAIRPPSEIGTAVTFAPCLYTDVDKRRLLKAVIAHYRSGLEEWSISFLKTARQTLVDTGRTDQASIWQLVMSNSPELREVISRCHANLQFDLVRISPLLKSESFHEEKEWRLVLPVGADNFPTTHPIEFRPILNGVVPYIAYPL